MYTKLVATKPITKIIIVLLVVVVIALLIVRGRPPLPQPKNTPTPQPIDYIESPPNVSKDVNYIFETTSLSFPLPDIEYQAPPRQFSPQSLASLFDLSSTPQVYENEGNPVQYSWKEEGISLVLSLKGTIPTAHLTTNTGVGISPPAIPFTQAEEIALQFIQQKLSLPPEVSVKPTSQKYSFTQGNSGNFVDDPSQANTTVLTYTYTINGIPLYLSKNAPENLRIIIGGDGSILQFFFYILPQLNSVSNQNSVNVQEAIDIVKTGKGILFQALPNVTFEGLPSPNYAQTNISTISPAYLFDPNQTKVRLVYQIEGTARDTNNPKIYYNIMYLTPAKL